MQAALQIASIIISVVLIIIILLQVKGSGLGDLLGGSSDSGVTRTRRGLEKTLYQITIGLAFIFLLVSVLSVYYTRA
ncbi:MAG: preprotein translocase subunit SecG [Pleurocapsa minor GSE-CHR-MK-17-07R]|jgi:preprotein translocase subunit SecG|nr:preprotein translocase subunit SecG [Pleurocapsa minor GSE-CHR-MK 17-07R]